jgi:hypothetical protein
VGVVAYSIAWANGHGSTPGSNSHTLFNNVCELSLVETFFGGNIKRYKSIQNSSTN